MNTLITRRKGYTGREIVSPDMKLGAGIGREVLGSGDGYVLVESPLYPACSSVPLVSAKASESWERASGAGGCYVLAL